MDTYLVGGAVRDQLLGLAVNERDWVVVGSTPEQMQQQGFRQVGKEFPVFIHPTSGEEYALARTERKIGKGYTAFACHASPEVTLEEDLLRRDLTINAMAQTTEGDIIDPYGGQGDLDQRILRHVSAAFVEDPLRVLRLARFAAQLAPFGFTIAEETKQLLLTIVRHGEMQHLVAERVWLELEKALATSAPHLFIQVLRQCGALAILFPELDRLFGIPNPPIWHPEIDSGIHTLMVLQQAAQLTEDKAVRFAGLIHDLGKGLSPIANWPSHTGHGEKGVALIKDMIKRYPIPNAYADLAVLVSRFHIACHKCQESSAAEVLLLLEGLDAFRRPQRMPAFFLTCHADIRGRTGHEEDDYPQQSWLLSALAAANAVDIKALVAQGLPGADLAVAIRKQRLAAIEVLMSSS